MSRACLEFDTPLGPMRAVANGDSLVVLDFLDSRNLKAPSDPPSSDIVSDLLSEVRSQVLEYFGRRRTEFSIPLSPEGTETQLRVWNALTRIPYGATTTYGKLAEALQMPNGQRAVGMINGQNPIAILIPCHRVIASTGKLQGYAGGLDRKRFLLDLESGPSLFE